ncbi:MAG: carbohydrate kinase [Planctomycetota bacterium]|jgi:L-xylulokinase|nr:carbohydrate kinase [Planctomycetota bacterium]
MAFWIGVDSGGTFIKAGVYDEKGVERAIARHNVYVVSRNPGWAERDMDQLYVDACQVVKDALSRAKIPPSEIKGLAISAQGKGLYAIGADMKPAYPGVLSSDQRSLDVVRAWERDGVHREVYKTSLHTIWTGHPVSILRWIKENEPDVYKRIRYFMMSHDYLRFRMTGRLGCEITNISESDLYNMKEARYDQRLADLLGISEAIGWLPPTVGAAEITGGIDAATARATGLPEGVPVAGGLFDVMSTALCAGIVDDSRLNAVMGTWSIITGITRELGRGDEFPRTYGVHAEKGYYQTHEGSPTSAGNLDWFAPYLSEGGKFDLAGLEREVASVPKASTDIQFLPFLYGSNAGLGMKSGLYGLQALHEPRHIAQAIYEGVIFCHNMHLVPMLKYFPRTEALRVTGGPTKSDVWMRMLADVSGLPVEIPEIEETGCVGSAMAAAVGTGAFPDFRSAIDAFNPPLRTVEPDKSSHEAYQAKYGRYVDLIKALRAYEGID